MADEIEHSFGSDVVTVRTVPPLVDWPDWSRHPGAEFRILADSLKDLEPAPGYRFRRDGGVIVHEKV